MKQKTVAVDEVLRQHLARPDSGWSIGAFGAIAEFMRDVDEPLLADGPFIRATQRGAIRLERRSEVRPIAYETVSARPDRWLHGVAFCLKANDARMHCRATLTELGPDNEAVLESDRAAVLFDIGAGVSNVDACIRTADAALIAVLRRSEGHAVINDAEAMARITQDHPHRVFVSRLGRIEVRQRIGSDDADPPTPEGPHTHVIPRVLARRRTHSANLPVPSGMVPCLNLYPANPIFDALGRPRAFDRDAFAQFQALLESWGDRAANDTKASLTTAVASGLAPESFRPSGRFARAAARVALRQLAYLNGAPGALAAWRAVHDAAKYHPEDHHPDH